MRCSVVCDRSDVPVRCKRRNLDTASGNAHSSHTQVQPCAGPTLSIGACCCAQQCATCCLNHAAHAPPPHTRGSPQLKPALHIDRRLHCPETAEKLHAAPIPQEGAIFTPPVAPDLAAGHASTTVPRLKDVFLRGIERSRDQIENTANDSTIDLRFSGLTNPWLVCLMLICMALVVGEWILHIIVHRDLHR